MGHVLGAEKLNFLIRGAEAVVLVDQFYGRLRRGDRRVEELEAFLPDAHGGLTVRRWPLRPQHRAAQSVAAFLCQNI